MKISANQMRITLDDGKQFSAIRSQSQNGCRGCAFISMRDVCRLAPSKPHARTDGRRTVFRPTKEKKG